MSHFTAKVAVTVPPECTQLDTARPALSSPSIAWPSDYTFSPRVSTLQAHVQQLLFSVKVIADLVLAARGAAVVPIVVGLRQRSSPETGPGNQDATGSLLIWLKNRFTKDSVRGTLSMGFTVQFRARLQSQTMETQYFPLKSPGSGGRR